MWIKKRGWTDGKLALAARVSRASVQAAAKGNTPLAGKLKAFLLEVDPEIVAQQDAYREILSTTLREQAQAA